MKDLKFEQIIETIIGDINEAKRKSSSIHLAGNIKASGDEIEDLIRDKISLFLPERYLVKQGHIINSDGKVSNQLDIIIFDRLSTPKFFETQNKTVFYPIESVLAIGEIKKTLRAKDIIDFGNKIKFIKEDMSRELVPNTVFGGKLDENTTFSDMMNISMDMKYKNPLFSFIFAIDVENINKLYFNETFKNMPNDIYILNDSVILAGKFKNNELVVQLEDEHESIEGFVHIKKSGVFCLATMFNQLINHLNKCHITPFSVSKYMTRVDTFGVFGKDITAYNVNKKNVNE